MRAGTWATVIAILIIIAIGWWVIDWSTPDPVPASAENRPVATEPAPPAEQRQQQGEAPGQEAPDQEAPGAADPQQTVGQPAPADPRPAD
ncbi:hypothetical protein ACM64Y_02840 [Novispirillum sp. DQ9]|uniref:hypothetical protein n=1 Tax=Novispirillum sp. DQ9 TaxID=3398612 RepID=UPI003C7A5FD7